MIIYSSSNVILLTPESINLTRSRQTMSPDERKIHIPSQLGSENLGVQLQILQRRLIAFSPQSADKLFQRLVFVTISAQLGTQMLVIRFHIPQIRFQRLDLAEISFQLDAQLPVLLLQVLDSIDVELERLILLLELVRGRHTVLATVIFNFIGFREITVIFNFI